MPQTTNREYRRIDIHNLEVREDQDGRMIVEGYATTFNKRYVLFEGGGYVFDEEVDPHAFDETDMSDVIMQYDHQGRVFARTKNNTLELHPDDHGLHVRAYLEGTDIGRQLYQEIKGGYTDKMSFGFTVNDQKRSEEQIDGKNYYHRRIMGIKKLYDVSAVSLPANDTTEISARSYCDGVIAELEAERLAAEQRARDILKLKLKIMMEV